MTFIDSLRTVFPIQTEDFALVLAHSATDYETGEAVPALRVLPNGSTAVTIQLIVYDLLGGSRQVRDIKEQCVVVLAAKHRDDPRAAAYITGWREAVLAVFESQEALRKRDRAAFDRLKHSIDSLMPHDLCKPEVLDLKRPRDAAAFTDALLSTKRFGYLLV